jgi:hypothetical protein
MKALNKRKSDVGGNKMKRGVGVLLALALAATLLVAGCGQSKPQPAVDFTTEQNGEALLVRAQTTGFNVPKDGHLHIQLDDGPVTMAYQTTYTFPKVAPGKHKVTVGLSDLQHNALGIAQSKDVEIK